MRYRFSRRGYRLNAGDLMKNEFSSSELEKLIGDRDPEEFLNPRSTVYRKKKLGDLSHTPRSGRDDGYESGFDSAARDCCRRARRDRL